MINILYLHAGAEMYGADKVMLELIKGLDKSKFNPIVILPCEGELVDKLKNEGIDISVIPYPILRRKYFNPTGILKYTFSYKKYSHEILNVVKEKNINLLHINTTAVLEGIYLKKRLNIPLIWHIHEILVNPNFIYIFLSHLIGKFADKAVVVSDAVGNHLMKSKAITSDKVKIIYNGVNNTIFNSDKETAYLFKEFELPYDSIIIGMIGRVNAWKGQNDFLSAVEPILINNRKAYALMVGGVFEGEEWRMKELQDRVASSPVKSQIILQDFRSDISNIHNLFNIFVLPSTRPDPLPTVVLEAMASGKPIIGYKHGGICEMVINNKNGLLAEVGNTANLSKKIGSLLANKKSCLEMGLSAEKIQKENFSLENYINNFSELYRELSEKQGG